MARILVVDDEEMLRTMTKQILERLGHEVITASNGLEGLQMMEAHTFQVVVSDNTMPYMMGVDFLRKVQEKFLQTKTILMSALPMEPNYPGDIHLNKPFDYRQLEQAVIKVLST